MRITNGIFALLFAYFAFVQYNDPDPWLWIVLYAFIAAVALFGALGHYNKWVFYGGMVLFAGFFIWLFPSLISWLTEHQDDHLIESMSAEKPWIEESRECLGALIGLIAMVVMWRFSVAAERKKNG